MARRARRERETAEFLAAARRFIRAAGERVADADEVELGMLLELRHDLDAAISQAVNGQRSRGASWAYIALAAGTTRQAAQQRWGALVSSGASTTNQANGSGDA